ncbi:putative Ser/Thr protein kinase [Haloferula luteola]|uniref:Putative Ser/Thr protein kinase n=1 Tax=Haloferula luteola TaxID=595692 RepID=A0A840V616_9BACT|nr:serine/threonine-protein kinase [Haloferula luteola]MBB5352466.1 putative Ser/Thr protein kinase [Haloferula luteola]
MNFESQTMPEGERSVQEAPWSPEEMRAHFPQFELLEYLGRGGMGVVYKARQKALDRVVAIKVLAGEWQGDPGFATRFEAEAKILAQMSHPNIVTVHDFGEVDGLYYLVMEFVDGVNLRDLLREGRMASEQALAIVPPICDALEYAHGKGVVHRDIKPENLLLDREGRVKIADFGIASIAGSGGEASGTPPYMAPEQERGRVDRRADIYALGVVLYEMLTGERPTSEWVAPSRKVQLDVKIDEMVLRALASEPERRYQTAGEFRTVVETLAATATTPAAGEAEWLDVSQLHELSADRKHWKLGMGIYFCRKDPRLVVPKWKPGWGWTLNFAHAWAWPFLAALIVLSVGVLKVAKAWELPMLAVGLGWLAAVIGVCHVMSRGPVRTGATPSMGTRSAITGALAAGLVLILQGHEVAHWHAQALSREGWSLWNQGRFDEAREKFTKSLQRNSEVAETWNGLGWASFNAGDGESGERAFQRAIELNPHHPGAWNGLGQIHLARGEWEAAEKELLKAAERNATAAWAGLARLYWQQKRYAEAERWAQKLTLVGQGNGATQQILDAAREEREWSAEQERRSQDHAEDVGGGVPDEKVASTEESDHRLEKTEALERTADQVQLEQAAMDLIVAIRDGNEATLTALAGDTVEDWPRRLREVARELRERFRESAGKKAFDFEVANSAVADSWGLVRCTGGPEGVGTCVVMFFVRTGEGWRNCLLRTSTEEESLDAHWAYWNEFLAAADRKRWEEGPDEGPTIQANEFLDRVEESAYLAGTGLGEAHPQRKMAAVMLAKCQKQYPDFPNARCRKLAAERLAMRRSELKALREKGLGEAHPQLQPLKSVIAALQAVMEESDVEKSGMRAPEEEGAIDPDSP